MWFLLAVELYMHGVACNTSKQRFGKSFCISTTLLSLLQVQKYFWKGTLHLAWATEQEKEQSRSGLWRTWNTSVKDILWYVSKIWGLFIIARYYNPRIWQSSVNQKKNMEMFIRDSSCLFFYWSNPVRKIITKHLMFCKVVWRGTPKSMHQSPGLHGSHILVIVYRLHWRKDFS